MPIIRPKTAVLSVGGRKSLNVTVNGIGLVPVGFGAVEVIVAVGGVRSVSHVHVAGLASVRGLAFRSLRVDVEPGGSLQDHARVARHRALRAEAARVGAALSGRTVDAHEWIARCAP